MPNIARFAEMMVHLEDAPLAVAPERCVRVRNRNATCSRCARACSNGAISIADNALDIDYDRCSACGACATVCPTGALLASNPSFSEQFEAARAMAAANDGNVIVACSDFLKKNRRYDSAQVLKVPCLNRLDQAFFVGIALYGAHVTLIDGLCDRCPSKNGRKTFDESSGDAEKLLAAWDTSGSVTFAQSLPGSAVARHGRATRGPDLSASRRDFLSEMKTGVKAVAADAILEVAGGQADEGATTPSLIERLRIPTGGTMSQYVPQRNDLVLSFLDTLGKPTLEHIDSPLWGDLTIDTESCTSCEMCATFCPTGALSKHEDPHSYGLDFYPVDCVDCSLCVDTCMTHSIALKDGGRLEALLGCESIHTALEKPKAMGFNPAGTLKRP